MLFPLELKLCRILWSVDVVYVGGGSCAVLLGERTIALVLTTLAQEKQHLHSAVKRGLM